jgi:hypothetical protein
VAFPRFVARSMDKIAKIELIKTYPVIPTTIERCVMNKILGIAIGFLTNTDNFAFNFLRLNRAIGTQCVTDLDFVGIAHRKFGARLGIGPMKKFPASGVTLGIRLQIAMSVVA